MNIKKYWLRGGLIIVILGLFVYVSFIFSGDSTMDDLFLLSFPIAFSVVFLLYMDVIGIGEYSDITLGQHIILFLLSVFIYFLIGMLLGWAYGKIKDRKT